MVQTFAPNAADHSFGIGTLLAELKTQDERYRLEFPGGRNAMTGGASFLFYEVVMKSK